MLKFTSIISDERKHMKPKLKKVIKVNEISSYVVLSNGQLYIGKFHLSPFNGIDWKFSEYDIDHQIEFSECQEIYQIILPY